MLETPSTLLYLLSQSQFPFEGIAQFTEDWDNAFKILSLEEEYTVQKECMNMCCSIGAIFRQGRLKDIEKEVRGILEWCTKLPMGLIVNYLAFFVNTLIKIKSKQEWDQFKYDLNDYISFMSALRYYCSKVPGVNHMEFLPKISENFLKLGDAKKEEGLQNLTRHANGGIDGERKALLDDLIIQFSSGK